LQWSIKSYGHSFIPKTGNGAAIPGESEVIETGSGTLEDDNDGE